MDIVKNNLASIILGIIALVALTTPFWLINGYVSDLQAKGQQSRQANTSITTLLNRPRVMPAPTPEGQPQPLEQFPNEQTIAAGENLRNEVQQTAQRMLDLAIEMNRQPLLVKGSLPDPRGSEPFHFRNRYNEFVKPRMLRVDVLNGGMPPNPDEIKLAQERLWTDVYSHKIRTLGGGQTNEAQIKLMHQQEAAKVGSQMTMERAGQIKMYVEPNAFTWHPAFEATTGQPPTAEQMWYAQLGIWIQANFAAALADANADARNVLDSVVKHLIRIEFPDNPYVLPAPAGGASQSGDPGGYPGQSMPAAPQAMADLSQPLPRMFDRSVTGRVSNGLFDVVHFRATVIVDATRFPQLLQQFGQERLMYVRTWRIESVDSAGQQLAGYVYGNAPVVRAELEMEMLFLREWAQDLMPQRVLEYLGIPTNRSISPMEAGAAGYPSDPGR